MTILLGTFLTAFLVFLVWDAMQWKGTGEIDWHVVKTFNGYVYEVYAEKQIHLGSGRIRYKKQSKNGRWVYNFYGAPIWREDVVERIRKVAT